MFSCCLRQSLFYFQRREIELFTTHTNVQNDPSEFDVYEWTEKLSLHTNTKALNLPPLPLPS